jgi:hypothetical protein
MTLNIAMPSEPSWCISACVRRYFTLATKALTTISAATTSGAIHNARCSQNSRRTSMASVVPAPMRAPGVDSRGASPAAASAK